jgi:hypothetical protein
MSSTQQLLLAEGAVNIIPNYIEEVFSTFIFTGNNSTQTIVNGIDLATKGGLVWSKSRNQTYFHSLYDTARGVNKRVFSNSTLAQITSSDALNSFNTNGFSLGSEDGGNTAPAGNIGVSWTFREQPKFFDIVTYTGTGTARTVAHNLGSVPGCMLVKRLDTDRSWAVYHRSLGATMYLNLEATNPAQGPFDGYWNNTEPTSTVFTVRTDGDVNTNGGSYVAYLFAHDAGGFGTAGTDNVISCGSFTTAGSGRAAVNLGWEPQWLLVKRTNAAGNWLIVDNMRGLGGRGDTAWTNVSVQLNPNLTNIENTTDLNMGINPSGFNFEGSGSSPYIYIAIRRGPMKVPTSGTSVFSPITNSASTGTVNTTGFPVDMGIVRWRISVDSNFLRSRLQGVSSTTAESGAWLKTNAADLESTGGGLTRLWNNTGFQTTSGFSGLNTVYWNFGRAPSFFDEVCYTGNDVAGRNITHNLAAVPELIIVKSRTSNRDWMVYSAPTGATNAMNLNNNSVSSSSSVWESTAPTSTVFTVGNSSAVNDPTTNYVAFLFATAAGVSKVGSYTGTGAAQTINCGFTSGSRFVLIKRTDSTGDWYVWDSARGISSVNDPFLFLNSTAVENDGTSYVDTTAVGFDITSTAPAGINANGGTYIFLAIA